MTPANPAPILLTLTTLEARQLGAWMASRIAGLSGELAALARAAGEDDLFQHRRKTLRMTVGDRRRGQVRGAELKLELARATAIHRLVTRELAAFDAAETEARRQQERKEG